MKLNIFLTAVLSLLFVNVADAQLKIYYVRHAEAGHNVKKQWQEKGVPEAEWPAYVGDQDQFTPKGLEQVTAGTKKLQKYRFDFIASSSMWRARNTVLPYLKLSKQKAEVWPELIESPGGQDILADDLIEVKEDILNLGRTLPKLPAQEQAFFEYRKDTKSIHKKAPKGSSRRIKYAYTKKVMLQVIERLKKRFGGTDQSILLVGHNSSGTALMKLLLQAEPAEEARGALGNFGMWMVEQQPDGSFELKIHNDQPYKTENQAPRAAADSGGAELSQKPNVVFVMSDDQRWDTFGCYGRTDVSTPNIDKLAADGVVFDNAYYAVAICMPSRTTMFTGRYFSDHQTGFSYPYNRTLPKSEFADSYPAQLKAAGYRTGFVGKFGVRLEARPKTVAEYFDFYAGISTTSKNGPHFPADDEKLNHIFRKDRDPKERTLIKGDAMIHFLDTQPKDQPFCLSVSFDAVKNDRDSDMYGPHVELFKDKEMWVPENWVQGKNTILPKVLDHCRGTSLHMKRTSTPELYQTLARRFAVQGYTVDVQVGRLMAKLQEMDVLDNTIVIYTSDNGRFHGSHGIYDKCILYDESMKEPLIVFDGRAAGAQRGRRENALVSSVDVAPTILSLAGVAVPEAMKGMDLSDVLAGTQDMSQWRAAVLMENLFLKSLMRTGGSKGSDLNQETIANNESYRTRGVRTERFKYFKYYEHDPVIEEFYDMKADPSEQYNLISKPEYAVVIEELRQKTEELHSKTLTK